MAAPMVYPMEAPTVPPTSAAGPLASAYALWPGTDGHPARAVEATRQRVDNAEAQCGCAVTIGARG